MFLNIEHSYAINFNVERCLTVKVISKPCHLVITFFEIFTRILYKFFNNIIKDIHFYNKKLILKKCFDFVNAFIKKCMKIVRASVFEEIFFNYKHDVDYFYSFIKIIDKDYIDYFTKK